VTRTRPSPARRTARVDVESSLGGGTGSIVSVATSLTAQAQLAATRGVDPAALDAAVTAAEPVVVAARPEDPAEGLRIGLGAVGAFLLYFSIQTYGAFVAQGVVEEKASRVVELVLATVRPWQLLLGKVLGLGAVGLLQLVVLTGAGLGVAGSAGLLAPGAGLAGTLVSVLVWYLLGFAMYATIYAALGSLVSRQEDTQSVLTPGAARTSPGTPGRRTRTAQQLPVLPRRIAGVDRAPHRARPRDAEDAGERRRVVRREDADRLPRADAGAAQRPGDVVRERDDLRVAAGLAVEGQARGVAPERRPLVQVGRQGHQVTCPCRRRPAGPRR
jgi:ABC-2 family transporter